MRKDPWERFSLRPGPMGGKIAEELQKQGPLSLKGNPAR